jgi:hypothetical protein
LAAVLLTTVDVLLSLEWLVLLTLLACLVVDGGFDAGAVAAAAPRRVRPVAVEVPDELELVLEVVVVFLADAAARVDLAFSTRLLSMLDAAFDRAAVAGGLEGEAGRAS